VARCGRPDQQLITWSGPPDGDVRIELSIDGGNNYQTIFGSTLNDGEQLWTVPSGSPPGPHPDHARERSAAVGRLRHQLRDRA
jgi:hypothetical protein